MSSVKKNSIAIFVIYLFVTAFHYSCKPTISGQFDPENTYTPHIFAPKEQDHYYNGEELVIQWECKDAEFIKLELLNREQVIAVIAQKTENDGEFHWIITDVEAGNEYKIKLSITGDFPYKFNCRSFPFIIDKRWQDLGPVDTDNAYGVSLTLDTENNPILFYKQNINTANRINIKKWNGESWVSVYEHEDTENYSSFTGTINNENEPFIAYVKDITGCMYIAKLNIDGTTWQEYETGGEALSKHFIFGISMDLDNNQNPVISYIMVHTAFDFLSDHAYVLSSYWDGNKWNFFGSVEFGDNNRIVEESSDLTGILDIDMKLALEIVYGNSQYSYIPVYTSIMLNEQNFPIIAYIDYTRSSGEYRKQVSIKVWNGSIWQQLGNKFDEIESYYPSMAAGSNDLPVVCFLDGKEDKKAVVKKWNGSTWTDLHFPIYSESGFPAITVGEDNNPIVAVSSGIYKWNGEKWDVLGYPNSPGKGTGQPSWWIAESDNKVFIAFIDPVNPDQIQVKMIALG